MDKNKFVELELQNLFLARTSLMQVLIVLTGGVVGLFFIEPSFIRTSFIIAGFLTDLFIIKNFIQVSLGIKQILSAERKRLKNDD